MEFKNRRVWTARVDDDLNVYCTDKIIIDNEDFKKVFEQAAEDLITYAKTLTSVQKQNWKDRTWTNSKKNTKQNYCSKLEIFGL